MLTLQFLQEATRQWQVMAVHTAYNEDIRKLRETEFSHVAGTLQLVVHDGGTH